MHAVFVVFFAATAGHLRRAAHRSTVSRKEVTKRLIGRRAIKHLAYLMDVTFCLYFNSKLKRPGSKVTARES